MKPNCKKFIKGEGGKTIDLLPVDLWKMGRNDMHPQKDNLNVFHPHSTFPHMDNLRNDEKNLYISSSQRGHSSPTYHLNTNNVGK
jgi:hypothetical protein